MASSKMNITIPKNLQANVRRQLEEAISDPKLLNKVGDIAVKDIKAHILQAKSPETGGAFREPNITPEWQKRKRRLSTVNKAFDGLSGGGSGKARLIFTGQFLQSFNFEIRDGGIDIGPDDTPRSPYRNLNGSQVSNTPTNLELGQYLIDQGRDWRGVSKQARARLVNLVRSHMRRKLKD